MNITYFSQFKLPMQEYIQQSHIWIKLLHLLGEEWKSYANRCLYIIIDEVQIQLNHQFVFELFLESFLFTQQEFSEFDKVVRSKKYGINEIYYIPVAQGFFYTANRIEEPKIESLPIKYELIQRIDVAEKQIVLHISFYNEDILLLQPSEVFYKSLMQAWLHYQLQRLTTFKEYVKLVKIHLKWDKQYKVPCLFFYNLLIENLNFINQLVNLSDYQKLKIFIMKLTKQMQQYWQKQIVNLMKE